MNFKNDKITLSFYELEKYLNSLNINLTESIIYTLCHKDYIISKDKDKYVCKMRYSEERIKKANSERLKKKSKNKIEVSNENKNVVVEETQIEKLDLKESLQVDEKEQICLSPDKNIEGNIIDNEIPEIQTARSSSYLFYDDAKNQISNIPDNILDVYEELDLKDQIIEKLENDIINLREEINIRDKKILKLIKKINNFETNSFLINKKNIIYELDNLSLQQNKIYENINNFIMSLEKVPPKRMSVVINEKLTKLKDEINNINALSNTINSKIIKLLNY